jgi:hypothetical protein
MILAMTEVTMRAKLQDAVVETSLVPFLKVLVILVVQFMARIILRGKRIEKPIPS